MTDITLHALDTALVDALVARALGNRRSVEAEAGALIAEALGRPVRARAFASKMTAKYASISPAKGGRHGQSHHP